MNVIEAQGKNLHLWGRKEDGRLWHKYVQDFDPYFYVKSSDGNHRGLMGETLRKITVDHPAEVPKRRDNYDQTWEADITYVNRYLIDRVDKITNDPLRKWFLDIEVSDEGGFPSIREARNPVLSIAFYDSFLKRYYVLLWHPDKKIERKEDDYIVHTYRNESTMFKAFMAYLSKKDPDLITAWFGETFDFPYLLRRMRRMGISLDDIGRIPGSKLEFDVYGKDVYTKVRGRALLDLYWAYRKLIPQGRESYSLDYIGQLECNIQKLEKSMGFRQMWLESPEAFIEYNKRDVEIIVRLDQKLDLIGFMNELRIMAKADWSDLLANTRLIDFYILDFCKKHKIRLPSKTEQEKRDYEGALVFTTHRGVHDNVLVFDLKSLYPSIILTCNMSYETWGKDGIQFDRFKFSSSPPGIMPQVIDTMFAERTRWKKVMNDASYGSDVYTAANYKQYAIKVLMNSVYGAMGSPYFRLFNPHIAEAITWFGRNLIDWCRQKLEKDGCTVLAGDTDSVIFKLPKGSDEDMIPLGGALCKYLNEAFWEFTSPMGIAEHRLVMEFEKIYGRVLFVEGKKRRAGHVIWMDGKDADHLEITGFESKRSDTPGFARDMQKHLFEMLVKERKEKPEIMEYLKGIVHKMQHEMRPEDIALPIGISKMPSQYGRDDALGKRIAIPAHVKAALNANKYHDMNIVSGTKFKWIYVSRTPGTLPKFDAIAFTEDMPKGYEIDMPKMRWRVVDKKLEKVFDALGWNILELDGQKNLGEWCS